MHFDKYKYLTPQKASENELYARSPPKSKFQNRPQSPKYQESPRSPKRESYFNQNPKQSHHSPKLLPSKYSQHPPVEAKLESLILQTLSSADKIAQELLNYGQPASEYLCSSYFLSREKLHSHLNNPQRRFQDKQPSKNSKKSEWWQENGRESGSSDATQEVPIGHLQRLERIVYNQIIPILETQLSYERRKVQKHRKPQQQAYTSYKEGLLLLERLNQKKKKTDLDDYADVLEKFIRRVMDKEEALMNKLFKLQQKLQTEMKKTGLLSQQNSQRQAEPEKKEEENSVDKGNKENQLYQNFVREIKSYFKDSSKDSSPKTLRVELNLLLSHVKNAVCDQGKNKQQKACVHKYQKSQRQIHSHCKQEQSRSEQQVKTLKEVVGKLDREVESLRERCQVLEQQVALSTQKLGKVELKSNKLIRENQQLNQKIQSLTADNCYKNNVIGEYVNMANRLQEHMKAKEDRYMELQQQNQRCLQNLSKKDEEYQKLLRHLQEIQDRNKQLEQLEDQAHRDLEELIQKNYVREFQVAHITNSYERHLKELEDLKQAIREKDQIIALLDVNKEYILDCLETQSKRQRRHSFNQRDIQSQTQGDPLDQETPNFLQRLSHTHQANQKYHLHNLHQELPHFISQAFSSQRPTQLPDQMFNFPPMIGQSGPYRMSLQPNPLNQSTGAHLQLPDIMNQLASNPQSANTSNPLENTIFTPHFNDNLEHNSSQDDEHYHLKRTLGERYANLFNEISIRNSLKNNGNSQEGAPEHSKQLQADVIMLQQTVHLLQEGTKQAQQQIQRLQHENKLLMANNQYLFQKLYAQQNRISHNTLSGISLDGYYLTQQQFNNIQRQFHPNLVPQHINKQVIQEVIKDLDQEKKSIDQRSHTLKEQIELLKRQSDMIDDFSNNREGQENPQRKGEQHQDKEEQENYIKKRRDDWDAGHRFIDHQTDHPQKKGRREDWDPGHRFNGDIDEPFPSNNETNQYLIKVDPQNMSNNCQRSDDIEIKIDIDDHKQASEDKTPALNPKIQMEFINEKEPTLQELQREQNNGSQKRKSNIIPIESQNGSNRGQADLIKIEQKQPEDKSNTDQHFNYEPVEDNHEDKEEFKGQQHLRVTEMEEAEKIKQLLEATHNIRDTMRRVLAKEEQVDYREEIKSFLSSINALENMLTLCKKSTTKKLNKLQRIQILKKQAEEEIRLLKKKLQTANQLFSNITSNEEAYDLSFSQQLQQILRRSPKITDENIEGRTKQVNQVAIQTDRSAGFLQSSVRRYLPADFKKFMSSESLVNSLLNKSFIDELQNLNVEKLPNQEKMKKIESAFLDHEQLHNTQQGEEPEESYSESHTSNNFSEDMKRSRVRIESEVREIGNMIGYHRDQILYLHNILTKTMSMPTLRRSDRSLQTPRRSPLINNDRYVQEINRAPQKQDKAVKQKLQNQGQQSDKQHRMQIQKMLQNRESQLQRILLEREQQIDRLKAIVKKLTQLPSNQSRISLHQSRNIEMPNHQIEQLKGKLEEFELALERQTTENQKLKLEIKEQEVQLQLLKMKFRQTYELQINSFREISPQEQQLSKNKGELNKQESNKDNAAKILSGVLDQKQSSKRASEKKEEPNETKEPDNTGPKQQIQIDRNIENNMISEGEAQPQSLEQQKGQVQMTKEKSKRFQRKSQRIKRQTHGETENARSQIQIKDSLKDLLPQFFGEKRRK